MKRNNEPKGRCLSSPFKVSRLELRMRSFSVTRIRSCLDSVDSPAMLSVTSSSRAMTTSGDKMAGSFWRKISTARTPKLSTRIFEATYFSRKSFSGELLNKLFPGSKKKGVGEQTHLIIRFHTVDCF